MEYILHDNNFCSYFSPDSNSFVPNLFTIKLIKLLRTYRFPQSFSCHTVYISFLSAFHFQKKTHFLFKDNFYLSVKVSMTWFTNIGISFKRDKSFRSLINFWTCLAITDMVSNQILRAHDNNSTKNLNNRFNNYVKYTEHS